MTKIVRNLIVVILGIVASMAFSCVQVNAEEELVIDNAIQYTVSEGTIYWESSDKNGDLNTVCDENQYTASVKDGKMEVWIDGYAILSLNEEIVDSYFEEKVQAFNIPAITDEQKLMLHIWGEEGYRLGWVDLSQISSNENSEYIISEIPEEEEEWFDKSEDKTVDKTADTLKKGVEKDSEADRISYILADFSGSMVGFQSDVLTRLDGTDGNKYVFAESVEPFISGKNAYKIGGTTNIANALNVLNISNDSHVYILSDLNDNCGCEIQPHNEFVGEITIVYYNINKQNAIEFMKKLRNAYPKASITGF